MVRVKCVVSYDGSKFHGFQVQNKLRTVQFVKRKLLFMAQDVLMLKYMELSRYFILIRQDKLLRNSGKEQ